MEIEKERQKILYIYILYMLCVCVKEIEREREILGARNSKRDTRYDHIAPILLSIPPVGRYLLRSLFFLRTVEQKEITRAPGVPFTVLRYPRPSPPPVFYAFSFPSLVPLFLRPFPFLAFCFCIRQSCSLFAHFLGSLYAII